MGMVFGKIDVECMPYTILRGLPRYEIRSYPTVVVAETFAGASGAENNSFRKLAKYIGVFGVPENTRKDGGAQRIAMTGPVLTKGPQPIAMTAPVLSGNGVSMAFVLPKDMNLETAPKPLSQDIKLREIPPRICAVLQFTWNVRDDGAEKMAQDFITELRNDGLNTNGEWSLARYNPPFTIPFLRTNEIIVELEDEGKVCRDSKDIS